MILKPSALNLVIVGLMVIIFSFIWRTIAAFLSTKEGHPKTLGESMAAVL